MGVPLFPLEQEERPSAAVRPPLPEWRDAQQNRARLSDAVAAADASMRSLSSLLLARAHSQMPPPPSLDRPPLSLSALARPLPPVPAPVRQVRDWSLSSPPPLAPASDSDSESELEDMPPLLSESPPSSTGLSPSSLGDVCPWALVDEPMQEAPLVRPRRDTLFNTLRTVSPGRPVFGSSGTRLSGSLSDTLFGSGPRPLVRAPNGGTGSGRRGGQAAAAAAAAVVRPLQSELAGMAGRVAELARLHQGDAHPAVMASLRELETQLRQVASTVAAAPPPPPLV